MKDLTEMKQIKKENDSEFMSLDLRREFPDADGFSARNLWYMKQWYSFYSPENDVILHQIDTELQKLVNQHKRKLHQLGAEMESEKVQQAFAEFPLPFALVPRNQKPQPF